MATIKKAQGGGLIRKGLRIINPAKDAADTQKMIKKIKKTETPLDRKIAKEIAPIRKEIDINKYNNADARPVVLTPEQKANNARILKEIREGKRKTGGKVGKMKTGGSIPKAQPGRLIRAGLKRIGDEAKAIKSGIDEGIYKYKETRFNDKLKSWKTGDPPKRPLKTETFTYDKNGKNQYGAYNAKYDGKGGVLKVKMRNGGSLSGLKASNKRVGPVDPKGAFTKVQKKTLKGAKGKASLTKDKQLGATKMKMGGKMKKC
jgi:hypothetical protein